MVSPDSEQSPREKITFIQLLLSTISAFIGVQSNKNRERDFNHGKISHFILIGLLFTLAFVVILIIAVHLIIQASTGG